jgi:hypothetical protein
LKSTARQARGMFILRLSRFVDSLLKRKRALQRVSVTGSARDPSTPAGEPGDYLLLIWAVMGQQFKMCSVPNTKP